MDELRNEVVAGIRSCLISTKGQVSLKQLEDDYRTLIGDRIPYAKLGFKNLEGFVHSVPTLTTRRGPDGQVFVDAQSSEKTAHISSMVSKQKSAPAKKKTVRIAPRYHQAHAYPPPATTKWRPKKPRNNAEVRNVNRPPPRLAAVSHNQFVKTYKPPSVPSKIVVPEKRPPDRVPSPPKELRRYNSVPQEVISRESNGTNNGLGSGEEQNRDRCLSNTMKRISRLMSGVNLERDSGTSSPTTEFVVHSYKSFVQEFTKTGNVVHDLKSFAEIHKLGDVDIKFSETKFKGSRTPQVHCIIKVGTRSYSSYPNDYYTREEAEKFSAQKALDDLVQKHGRRKSLLISSNDDIIERIPPMLEEHQGAVWMWQIEADYIDKYHEQLPTDWLQVIDSCLYVSIEKYPGGYVLKHCNPHDVLQKGKKLEINLNLSDVSVPRNTVEISNNNRLYALVTAAVSVNEIWCQHCGTPEYERFVLMTERMENYYQNNHKELLTQNITVGFCYVIFHDTNWLRVRILKTQLDGMVDCFLIDCGEQVQVSKENIYPLKREFAVQHAQAFVCRLDGLEELYEVSIDSDRLQNLVGKEFILETVIDESGENNNFEIPVVLYDVSSGASINEELIHLLTIDSALPILNMNTISEVYVSNIEPNGDVYIQLRTPGYYSVMDMLKQLDTSIKSDPPRTILSPITKENSGKQIYLVKCKTTDQWSRAVILDWSPDGKLVQIYYTDYGNTAIVNVTSEVMFPLQKLNELASQYPSQAVKVRIMMERIPEDFVDKASRLMPKENAVLLRIVNYDNENVAWVEFFKRSSEGGLFCINKSISVEAEIQSNDSNSSKNRLLNLVKYNDNKNVPSGGSLKKPDLPKKGEYFSINIPLSVNPWNFFVQPLNTLDKLTSMMKLMQETYKGIQYSPMQIDDIIPGQIYASKHDDGLWYRTSVLKVINSGSISVFYCDFGHYTSLTLTQLFPLNPRFIELPYQALKAKIAGIKPSKNKWTMEDCDVFNSLVTKKQFVSVLVNIQNDELHKSDIILELLLIDTSSSEDINIKEILIEKGIATSI